MTKISNYTDHQLEEIRLKLEDNLEAFRKKFILFFIGLVGFALSVVFYAFGAGGWGSIPMLALVGAWCAPLVIKFWFSGFGELFDFQYKEYEIDQYGNKRDVSKIDSVLTGPFLKCMAALLVALIALYLVPAEIIVRFINHIRFESKLGEKSAVTESPRREAVLTAIVIVAMIVVGAIGNIIATARENTSDMSNGDVASIIETIETKSKSYTINTLYNYNTESTSVCATVTENGGTVTFNVNREIKYNDDTTQYTIPTGNYTYKNGKWVGVDESVAFALSRLTIGIAFDLNAMKENPGSIVINRDKGLGGRIDSDMHDYYELRPKKNAEFQFEELLIAEDFSFATLSDQNYIYIFND